MATKLLEAYVEITSRMAMLDAGLSESKNKVLSFVGQVNNALGAVAVGLGVGAGAGFLREMAAAGGDLTEAMNKINVAFGGSAGTVIAFADDMADRFGMVKTTTLDAAANFGMLGQAAGMSAAGSAQLGTAFTKLAADASSFYNIPLEDAIRRLSSGLVGETEPMRRFGVLLSAAAVEQRAIQMGINDGTHGLTEQEKVLARIAIIMEGMAKVHGDIDRTIDNYTNAVRRLEGDWRNIMAEMGVSVAGGMALNMKDIRKDGWGEWIAKAGLGMLQWLPGSMGKAALAAAGGQNPFQADADKMFGVGGMNTILMGPSPDTRLADYMAGPEFAMLRSRVQAEEAGNQERRAIVDKAFRSKQETFGPVFDEKGKQVGLGRDMFGFNAFNPQLGSVGQDINRGAMLANLDKQIADKRAEMNKWSGGLVTDPMAFLKQAQEKLLQKPDETALKQLKELEKIREAVSKQPVGKAGVFPVGREN